MKAIIAVAVVALPVVAGCAGKAQVDRSASTVGPSEQDQETALEIVWEEALQMPAASRPLVRWLSPCAAPDEVAAGTIEVSTQAKCWANTARPGSMDLMWFGRISDARSDFAWLLTSEKAWRLGASYYDGQRAEAAAAQVQLEAAGL